MHPLLIKVGSIPIHTYGFCIAIGFLTAVAVIRMLARRSNLDVDKIMDITFWGMVVGLIGSRFLFILTQLDHFIANPMDTVKIWQGGLVFLGGPVAVVPFAYWYLKKHKLPFWKIADVLIPGLVIAHAFGRVGCVFSGCCYGKPTGTDFGLKFYSELVDPTLRGVFLHPTQIYESTSLLLIFVGLLFIFKKKVFDGQVILTYFIVYPVVRSVIEEFRGDLIRGFVIEGVLSTSQFISLVFFVSAVVLILRRIKTIKTKVVT